ncbi:hypothetical protein [Rhodococcus sp. NPDC060176]|uniref:hypothetical protein n=1 Tax=Rhodococcus sp. NPDC060176 TaxID=3347062 RepID=UPI0036469211
MTAVARSALIRHAISTDAAFAGRFIRSLPQAGAVAPTALSCMFSYLSLIMYESHKQLQRLDPAAASSATFTVGAADLLTRSRHSLKLFEDTHRGVQGQLDFFANEVAPAHHRAFIEPVRLPFASAWKADLGLTWHRDALVTSTFATTFALGYPPADLLLSESSEKTLNEIAQEFGQYFSSKEDISVLSDHSFATSISIADLVSRDVRSAAWFRQGFNGDGTPEINMLLSVFQGLMNTCVELFSLDVTMASRQTIFKLRYLTVYQILRSLEILRSQYKTSLLAVSRAHAANILTDSDALLIADPTKKYLRNTLMHYGPDSRIDLSKLTLDQPLYGVIE